MSNRSSLSLSTRTVKIYSGAADATARADIAEHIADVANPHDVTAEQVGLGLVDNTSDADKPISSAQAAALALKAPLASPALSGVPTAPTAPLGTAGNQVATAGFVQAAINAAVTDDVVVDLAAHLADTANPHSVTKAQVGLGAADNTADIDKPVSSAQQLAINVATAAAAAAQVDIDGHQANVSNPHTVTKAQVGLGNVANLAPSDLPVSTATQLALNLKAPLASPALTGTPTAPTAPPLDNSTRIATTAYADAADAVLDLAVDAAAGAAAAAQADADAAQIDATQALADAAAAQAAADAAQADATQALADAAEAQADADAALVAAAEAEEAAVDAVVPSRPGDAVALYGESKAGQPDAAVAIDPAWVVISNAGSVVRVTATTADDPQTVTPTAAYPVEPGRVYEVRWRAQRVVNPADPLNDSVTCGLQWLNNNKAALSSTVVANIPLVVADGVVERIARIGLSGIGLDYTAPANTIYVRPYLDFYGDTHTADAITIDFLDITASVQPAAVNVVTPASGATVTMSDLKPLLVNTGLIAALTIKLPASVASGALAELGFMAEVTTLTVQDSAGAVVATGPGSAYGPGNTQHYRYINPALGWVYWK